MKNSIFWTLAGLSLGACADQDGRTCAPLETTSLDAGTYSLREAATAVLGGASVMMTGEIGGDLDGDGCTDVLVSDPVADCEPIHGDAPPEIQRAYVHYRTDFEGRQFDQGDLEVYDTVSESWFGSQMRSAGDVDGDGFDDLWVGSQFVDASSLTEDNSNEGVAYLVQGPIDAASLDLANADAVIRGSHRADLVGFQIAVGDLNGDGFSDALLPTRNNGKIAVHYGPTIASGDVDQVPDLIVADGAYDATVIGDINGDDLPDVAVLAWGDSDGGDLYLFHSPIVGQLDLADANAVIRHQDPSTSPCGYFADAGDLTGDGRDELLCGNDIVGTNPTYPAAVRVFSWPIIGEVALSDADIVIHAPPGHSGAIPASGDFNGDGRPDIAITTHQIWTATGSPVPDQLSIFTHVPGPIASCDQADVILLGSDGDLSIGEMLETGDATGDGIDDVMLDVAEGIGQAGAWIIAGQPDL